MGAGGPGGLKFSPWRHSKALWIQSWAACSRWPCLSRKLLPAPAGLWFCERCWRHISYTGDDNSKLTETILLGSILSYLEFKVIKENYVFSISIFNVMPKWKYFHMIPMSLIHWMNNAPQMYHIYVLNYPLFPNTFISSLTEFCGKSEEKSIRERETILLFKQTDSEECNMNTFH